MSHYVHDFDTDQAKTQGRFVRRNLPSTGLRKATEACKILMEVDGPENFPIPERGVRTLDWLYVRTREAPLVLFDQKADPLEMENLIHSVDHKTVIKNLDHLVWSYMDQTGDHWQVEATFPPENYHTNEEGDRNVVELLKHAIVEP